MSGVMGMGSVARGFSARGGKNLPRPLRALRVVGPDTATATVAATATATAEAAPVSPEAETSAAPNRAIANPVALNSTAGFSASRAVNWPAIGAIAGLHAALMVGLVSMDVVSLKLPVAEPMLVSLVPAATTPPPPPPAPAFAPPLEVTTPVIVPPTIDILPPRPSPVQAVVAETPPPVTAPVAVSTPAPPAPAARPSAEPVADLSTSMISAEPPRYPVESRRRKEEGTVTLLLTVGTDGQVADIEVSRSSGFERLDKAALAAVKKWRWSPTVRNGVAVAVRGIVEIPFILKKS